MIRGLAALALLVSPGLAAAQALQCRVPEVLPAPAPAGPSAKQPRRLMPVTGFTLALSWQPEFCRFRRDRAADATQCGPAAEPRGFTLHGLWPDGAKRWPQYCRPAAPLPRRVLQENFCTMPSVQLLQHEWAKHGTCVQTDPARYFRAARRMYGAVRYPDMTALSHAKPSVGAFAEAFAAANPGLTPAMVKVRRNRRGWLEEVWLCLARDLRPARCPQPMSAAEQAAPLAIWRGGLPAR